MLLFTKDMSSVPLMYRASLLLLGRVGTYSLPCGWLMDTQSTLQGKDIPLWPRRLKEQAILSSHLTVERAYVFPWGQLHCLAAPYFHSLFRPCLPASMAETRTKATWDMLLSCSELRHLCSHTKMHQQEKKGKRYVCTWETLTRFFACCSQSRGGKFCNYWGSFCVTFLSFLSSSYDSSFLLYPQQHYIYYWRLLSFTEPNHTTATGNSSCLLWTTWTHCVDHASGIGHGASKRSKWTWSLKVMVIKSHSSSAADLLRLWHFCTGFSGAKKYNLFLVSWAMSYMLQ